MTPVFFDLLPGEWSVRHELPRQQCPQRSDVPAEIDRHEWSQLGCERYVREYIDPLKPVIITGALDHWAARRKWTLGFFRDHYGDLPLEVDGRKLSMAQLIEEVIASTPDAPAPYLRNYLVKNYQ